MATARADPLRSTLDNLQLDPASEKDRPYLIAMLRRLGYTEREIDEVVRTGKMPHGAPSQGTQSDDGLAPARDYRLVVPTGGSPFDLDNAGAGAAATDAPFEDLERVEFQDTADELEFESVTEGEDLQWQDTQTQETSEDGAPGGRTGEALQWEDTQGQGSQEDPQGLEGQGGRSGPGEPGFDESAIDTFGTADTTGAGGPKRTRVRVRRIRASSKEEAERKVSGSGRNVIKSVPVDIVERWGADGKAKAPKKEG
ncbi:MAG: hypothetical protein WC876_09675 [Candidatus Thermoplasmatota archaeon]|jgi:hypothetical protein